MKKVTKFLILLIIFIGISSISSYSQPLEKKFIVFLINRMDLEDIQNMEFTKGLAQESAIGLMNTRAYGSSNDYSSSLSIGSGTRSEANYHTSRSGRLNKENLSIYQRRTGYVKDNESQEVANLDIAKLKEINKENSFNPIIGALGNSLSMNNIKISVIGNSDTDKNEARLGVLMGMDEQGIVDYGLVEEDVNLKDPQYPFGLKTNYDLMIKKFQELGKKSDFIILELGDLHRLEKYRTNLASDIYMKRKEIILDDIDLFIKKVYNLIDKKNTRVMILSPIASSLAASSGKRLTPVVLAGKGIDKGILSSDTTRREGIIGNIDIAPHIAAYFEGNINYFTGKPIYTLHKDEKSSYIDQLYNDTAFIYKNRWSVLFSFAIYEIIISLLAFLTIQLAGKYRVRIYRVLEYLLLSNMAIPIAILILPLLRPINIYDTFVKIIALTIALTLISVYIRKEIIDSIIFLSGLTCLILTLDILLGASLIKTSFLGYDPIIGARYYGIGNEFMGILVGATLVFTTALLDKYKKSRRHIIIVFITVIMVIGFPKFGANVGGTITAVFAFMFVVLRLYNPKLKFNHYIYILSSIFILISIIALVDLKLIEGNSHLANAIEQINNGGIHVVYSIIRRKVSMNLKLFSVSIWSKVLISSLIFLSVIFYRPFGIAKKVFNRYTNLSIGLLGILISCIVSFLVNDSGVVASATSIIFLAMTLMYLVVNEIKNEVYR